MDINYAKMLWFYLFGRTLSGRISLFLRVQKNDIWKCIHIKESRNSSLP